MLLTECEVNCGSVGIHSNCITNLNISHHMNTPKTPSEEVHINAPDLVRAFLVLKCQCFDFRRGFDLNSLCSLTDVACNKSTRAACSGILVRGC